MAAPESSTAPSALPRRTVLGAACAGLGSAAALSACGGQDGSSDGPAEPVDAGAVEDVPVGSGVKVDRDGVQAVVARPAEDTVVAFSPVCPHQGCMVVPEERRYVCPCHASQFDLATGEVRGGPARTGLTPYPVAVREGRIVLG
ncbi:Rieske 2Fe-2S domain-containing protein [Kocuria sediminis]|uniref:Cytochrome bc1 complex Rieske iron-sulfur subunit n=1 Tax=Kocuria sediminis TaxID=1038857 RepID=A0A6N8GSB0_9MICC|nr:Rieske (2Fe-2S) protein [Kocuria sediminis]MUN64173.1 Rieske 2Fe-2S domain-containing protein [Kocuria sediminis]